MDKNIFKKYISCLLIAAMCVSIASCGVTKKKSQLEEASTSSAQTKVLEEAKDHSKLADSDSKDKNSSVNTEEEPQKNTVPEKALQYAQGKLTETTYESEYVGVRFTAPKGYKLEPESVIKTQNELIAKSENEGQKYMRYEAIAANPDENMQVMVSVDRNKAEYDEITYLSNVASSYQAVEGAVVDQEVLTKPIANKEYYTMKISMNHGVIYYCVRKYADDMITFMIAFPEGNEEKVAELMSNFKPY